MNGGVIVIALLLGLIPAAIGRSKGHSFVVWWIFGALLFIVALPWAILAKPADDYIERDHLASGDRKCPYCAEWIRGEAIACRYCGRDVPAIQRAVEPQREHPMARKLGRAVGSLKGKR